MDKENEINTIYINLDLLLDYNSALFSLLRSFFLIYDISLNPETKLLIEMKDPEKAFYIIYDYINKNMLEENMNKLKDCTSLKKEFMQLFEENLKTIRPQIYACNFVNYIKGKFENIIILSYFLKEYTKIIYEFNKWLNFPIIHYKEINEIKDLFLNSKDFVYIDGNVDNLKFVSNFSKTSKYILIKNSNYKSKSIPENLENLQIYYFVGFEEINWNFLLEKNFENMKKYDAEYILNFDKKPTNCEFCHWKNIIYLTKPLILKSYVVKGFGRGGKQLGMPTANLEITQEIDQLLKPIVTGIYFGWVKFNKEKSETEGKIFDLDYSKKYKGVISTGFNPFYENQHKTFEIHLLHTFDNDYYGSFLEVEVLAFIRCESDLKCFDHLIKMIHNDVQIAKENLNDEI